MHEHLPYLRESCDFSLDVGYLALLLHVPGVRKPQAPLL